MKRLTKQLSLTLSEEVFTVLEQEAQQNQRPVSRQIRCILREYVNQYTPPEDKLLLKLSADQSRCASCRYFVPHYLKSTSGWFQAANCGHCAKPSMKRRKPQSAVCDDWTEK